MHFEIDYHISSKNPSLTDLLVYLHNLDYRISYAPSIEYTKIEFHLLAYFFRNLKRTRNILLKYLYKNILL